MKITVVADTHKDYHKLKAVIDENLDSDLVIHLGDGQHELFDIAGLHSGMQFIFIKGNTDFSNIKEERIVTVGGYKIFCAHGHTLNVHDGLELLLDKAEFNGCKIALYAHTHVYRTELINGIYVMNPGSVSSPRGKNPPTYGVIDISEDGKIEMNIVQPNPNSQTNNEASKE